MMTKTPADFVNFVSSLVKKYVSHPEDLTIQAKSVDYGIDILLSCHRTDQGKVIGTGGANVKALSELVRHAGMAYGIKAELRALTTGMELFCKREFTPNPLWDQREEMIRLLRETVGFLYPDVTFTISYESFERKGTVGTKFVCFFGHQPVNIEILDAIDTLFNAIGKQNGHRLKVAISSGD